MPPKPLHPDSQPNDQLDNPPTPPRQPDSQPNNQPDNPPGPLRQPDNQPNNQFDSPPSPSRQPDSQPDNQVDNPPGPSRQPDNQPNNYLGSLPESKSGPASGGNEGIKHTVGSGPSLQDLLSLFAILVMLIWPWIFFGVVWAKGGVQMDNHMAKVVTDNAHATTYFITLICAIISMIVSALFSLAVIRFAQELVTSQPTQPFHLSVLLAFRHRNWPWGKSLKDARYLLTKDRWWPAVLVVACVLTFPQLISTTTSLITPGPYNRTEGLTGTELDFSSTSADCVSWFDKHPLSNNCGYTSYNGLQYTNCLGENQMVDVLEAGRGNILELLTGNSESLSYSQLGPKDGLRFLGSIRGILPIGPNGVPAFNTLKPSAFNDPHIVEGMNSYNYTLNLQGLTSNVSCRYETTSPLVGFQSLVPNSNPIVALQYNVSCAALGQIDVLTNVSSLHSINGLNNVAYWACQSAPNGTQPPSYSIYLRGFGQTTSSYLAGIGNITCTVNPIQPAIFSVTYQSTAGIFSVAETNTSSPLASSALSTLLQYVLVGLADIITEGQNFQSNLVAESVITYGVKSFNLDPFNHTDQYLWLYERMIQGMIEYETTYLRLIYSTVLDPPLSCNRTVNGTLSYEVLGWFVTSANIGFLIPMTIINVAALVALLLAIIIAKTGGYKFHPLHPRPVTLHQSADPEELVPDEWKQKVAFSPRTLLKEYFDDQVKDQLKEGAQDAGQNVISGINVNSVM